MAVSILHAAPADSRHDPGDQTRIGKRIYDAAVGSAGFLCEAHDLVNIGRLLKEAWKLLGHHDPKVTMCYAHLSPQAMLETVNVVGM